jgi:hypothetical protein
LQTYELISHPAFMPGAIKGVSIRWSQLKDGRLMLRYRVDGCSELQVPDFRGLGRGHELWTHTCFELFIYDGAGRYREFNFSPSGQWAAYAFAGYRMDGADFEPVRYPEIKCEMGQRLFMATVFIDARELAGAERASLSAVLMEEGGRPSYWASVHNKLEPDFHDPACFRIPLGSAGDA